MVPGNQNDRGELRESAQGARKKLNHGSGWDAAIIDIPANQKGIYTAFPHGIHHVIHPHFKGRREIRPVQGAPEVPIGGVQDLHGFSLLWGYDKNFGPMEFLPAERTAPRTHCPANVRRSAPRFRLPPGLR